MSFINNSSTQHVSGTTMPIFRSARPYIAAYGFQHLMLLVGALGSRVVDIVHCVDDATRLYYAVVWQHAATPSLTFRHRASSI